MGIAKRFKSEAERIRIASELFTVTSRENHKGELHGLCPIHGENNPSFSYNFKTDVYNCFSCGASGDLLKLYGEVHNLGQKEGFKAFCETFGIENLGKGYNGSGARGAGEGAAGGEDTVSYEKAVDQARKAWEMFPPLPTEMRERREKDRGWSFQPGNTESFIQIPTLKDPKVKIELRLQTYYLSKNSGRLVKIKNPEKIAIPIRSITGDLMNVRLYKPNGGQFKIISWAKSTGSSRLFPAKPLSDEDPVLLAEGEPDVLTALSQGFNAITQTGKLKNWPKEHLAPFKGREVIIAYDCDEPGQKYAAFAAKALQGTAKSIRTIQWPSFMGIDDSGAYPKDHGQDLTDFFVRHEKTPADLWELINHAKLHDPNPTPAADDDDPGPLAFFERGVNDRLSFKPRLLADKIVQEGKYLSDPETGLMHRWTDSHFGVYEEDLIRNRSIQYLRKESQKSRVEDVTYQVKMLCTIPDGRKMNDRTDWICLKNCMLNTRTYEMRPHDPDFLCTYVLPVTFDPESDKKCEHWLRFVAKTIQTKEAIMQLQEFMGYILVRHTKYEKCLLLIGPGADGKSTCLKIMKELVGDENCAALSISDLEDQFLRSSLHNKMLNISTEVGAKAFESSYFKAITSGEPLNASFKHKNSFIFSPYCKLAFAGNRLPRVLDNSDGFFRRVLPIRFKRQFLDDDPDRDPDLFDTLKGEISEIFSWSLVGLARLVENKKFTQSDETRELMMEYRRINNPVLCYVQDQCSIGEEFESSKAELYDSYKSYCGKNGYTAMNRENFFRELYVAVHNIRQFRSRKSGTDERYLKGIEINRESNVS